jgi:hypothetical protein
MPPTGMEPVKSLIDHLHKTRTRQRLAVFQAADTAIAYLSFLYVTTSETEKGVFLYVINRTLFNAQIYGHPVRSPGGHLS